MLVLKTAAGGSTGGNGARDKRDRRVADAWRLWKALQEMELAAEFYEIACISDFKMLTLASETSIYARTAEINCHYLMTLSVLRYAV